MGTKSWCSGTLQSLGSDDQGSTPALGNEISIVGKHGLATGVNDAAPLGDWNDLWKLYSFPYSCTLSLSEGNNSGITWGSPLSHIMVNSGGDPSPCIGSRTYVLPTSSLRP